MKLVVRLEGFDIPKSRRTKAKFSVEINKARKGDSRKIKDYVLERRPDLQAEVKHDWDAWTLVFVASDDSKLTKREIEAIRVVVDEALESVDL